jgi:hypothetical protein
MKKILAIIALFVGHCWGQQINPATNIVWPRITGAGTPTSLSVPCSASNYGQPFQNTAVTPNTNYTCGTTGWQLVNGSPGSLPSPAVPYGVATVNPGATETTSSGDYLYDPTCGLISNPNAYAGNGNCLTLSANPVGLTNVNPLAISVIATGPSAKGSGETPYPIVQSQYDIFATGGGANAYFCQFWKAGVGDHQCMYSYWGGNSGVYRPSAQGGQGYVSQGGEGSQDDFDVLTYSGNVLTTTADSCTDSLPSQLCKPSVGGWVIKDSNYVRTNLIGASATLTGPCGASWLKTLATGGGLPTTSVCGAADNVNLAPNVAWSAAGVSESIPFTSGIGSFTPGGGDSVCVMGSNWIEEAVTTSATGSAGTQTLVLPLTRGDSTAPNVSVRIFKGHCSILSMDSDYNLSGTLGAAVTTSYPVAPSLDGTNLIYGIEAYGNSDNGNTSLPLTNLSAEVVAPAAATSTAYTSGQFIYDGTTNCEAATIGCVQQVTVGGTSGSSFPTWNATIGGSTTWGGVTAVNRGANSIVHVFPAARVVQTNQLSSSPYWSFQLAPNGLSFSPGDAAESPNFDYQNTSSIVTYTQCLTPSSCQPVQFTAIGYGLSGTSLVNTTNQNPISAYFNPDGSSTGVQPPSGYGLGEPYAGGSGLVWDTINSAYAPVNAGLDFHNHYPGQTSYNAIADNIWGQFTVYATDPTGRSTSPTWAVNNANFYVENILDATYSSGVHILRPLYADAGCPNCSSAPGTLGQFLYSGGGGVTDADTATTDGAGNWTAKSLGLASATGATNLFGIASNNGASAGWSLDMTSGGGHLWYFNCGGSVGNPSSHIPAAGCGFIDSTGGATPFYWTDTYLLSQVGFIAPNITDSALSSGLVGNTSGLFGAATTSQVSTLLQTATGCGTAGNHYDPATNTCTSGAGVYLPLAGGTMTGSIQMASGQIYQWNLDTGLSRLSADNIGMGNGTAGNTSAIVQLGQLNVTATSAGVPVASSCGGGSIVAGGNNNAFVVTGITAATSCTVTFSVNLPQGVCVGNALSSGVPIATSPVSTHSSASVTFTMAAAVTGTLTGICF